MPVKKKSSRRKKDNTKEMIRQLHKDTKEYVKSMMNVAKCHPKGIKHGIKHVKPHILKITKIVDRVTDLHKRIPKK